MSKSKNFSKEEMISLANKLCMECEEAWAINGYKKTSISHLTNKVGISPGSFYRLFQTKEDLFTETFKRIQNRLKADIEQILTEKPNKDGFVEALKWLYSEYVRKPYLYDFNSVDFQSYVSKISKSDFEQLELDSRLFSESITAKANLQYKVDKQLAFDSIQALLYTVSIQDTYIKDKIQTFHFLLDSLVDDLFV